MSAPSKHRSEVFRFPRIVELCYVHRVLGTQKFHGGGRCRGRGFSETSRTETKTKIGITYPKFSRRTKRTPVARTEHNSRVDPAQVRRREPASRTVASRLRDSICVSQLPSSVRPIVSKLLPAADRVHLRDGEIILAGGTEKRKTGRDPGSWVVSLRDATRTPAGAGGVHSQSSSSILAYPSPSIEPRTLRT